MRAPTATHELLEAHETALSQPSPGCVTARCSDHCRPFHRSASVPSGGALEPPASRFVAPTAVHTVADAQDTPTSVLDTADSAFGDGWIDHLPALQRSTSVEPSASPTAVQAVDETHDTLLSSVELLPGGRGVR